MPEWWKNSIESGSPPCSPQTPSFRSGLRLAPEPRRPSARAAPTPGASIVSNGERSRILHVDVAREEAALDVVAREAERGLGEVVGAEGEEVGVRRRSGRPRSTRAAARSSCRRGSPRRASRPSRSATRSIELAHQLELALVVDQRDHDLDAAAPAPCARARATARDDRLDLHLVDLGVEDPEPAAARAEHRVDLLQRAHALAACARARRGRRRARCARARPRARRRAVGQELVQRRVEQADRHRQAVHRLEDALEVALLQRQQLGERARGAPRRRRP